MRVGLGTLVHFQADRCRYEIHVGAAVRVLADPMAPREQKEFFRHVLARHKIILAATGAPKMLKKMAAGEYILSGLPSSLLASEK